MYISISKSEFLSSNNRNKVVIKNYNLKKDNLKAIIIILHGMSESKEIYSQFAEYLAVKGYGVITYDHIGHGESINTNDDRGFFANEDGYKFLEKDLEYIIKEAKKFNLPIFLFGHSMGSLIARYYVAVSKEREIDGLILSGTIGPQWAIDAAIQFAEYMVDKKGPRYRSRKLMQIVTSISTWKFENVKYKLEWATRDRDFIVKVKNDKSLNFIFTAAGFRDIFTLVKLTGQKENVEKVPRDLPIFMVSGSDDILGEYSEGVKKLGKMYEEAQVKDVTIKIYEESRHSLLQDLDRKQVYEDIYEWMEVVRMAKEDEKI